jgi:hypothetical protein
MRDRLRVELRAALPSGAVVSVVSHGDDELLALPAQRARHFPCTPDGTYAGHHPADDGEALARLAAAIADGVQYLALPAPSSWWLDFYPGFAERLAPGLLLAAPGTVTLYRLEPPA